MSLHRTAAIVRKELFHICRDPRNLFLVMGSPAFLLFLLAYVFSFDVGPSSLAVLDLDGSPLSRRYVDSLVSDQDLILGYRVNSRDEALPLLRRGDVDALLVIPSDFDRAIREGRVPRVQATVDGTEPLAGREVLAALEARSAIFVATVSPRRAMPIGYRVEVRTQAWYNPGMESLLSMVPGLMAVVLIMPTMAFALALTREKEIGTLEGLIATPVSRLEYIVGKLVAYIATALVSAVLALLVAVLWFEVPFRGSFTAFLLLTCIYFFACMSAVAVVASFVKSQQTAMFIVLLAFLVPSFFLAGLITPIAADSLGSIMTSYALPTAHFVEISRAIFLKGLGLDHMLRPALILLGMGVGALVTALLLFEKKLR